MGVVPSLAIETKLQERLSAPMIWKELCNVKYTDTGVIKNPYLTDATVSVGTRGNPRANRAASASSKAFPVALPI